MGLSDQNRALVQRQVDVDPTSRWADVGSHALLDILLNAARAEAAATLGEHGETFRNAVGWQTRALAAEAQFEALRGLLERVQPSLPDCYVNLHQAIRAALASSTPESAKLTFSAEAKRAALSLCDPEGSSTPESSEQPETGWLIEAWNSRTNAFQARWWSLGSDGETDPDFETLGSWTPDSTKALRFAREVDAQAYIDATGWTEAKPTDHAWVALPASASGEWRAGKTITINPTRIVTFGPGGVDLALPTPAEARSVEAPKPVAWRVQELSGSWVAINDPIRAREWAEGGWKVEPLYALPTPPKAEADHA